MNAREVWQGFPGSSSPAAHQLLASDALFAWLDTHRRPALRWYQVESPALVVGVGQPLDSFDHLAAAAQGIAVHRRASGGTAVLMTTDFLMLDVALPAGHWLLTPDVTQSYRWFGELWVAALACCGIDVHSLPVEVARARQLPKDDPLRQICFGHCAPYEIVEHERKLVGFSQIRRRNGAILQAGCYRHWRPELLTSLLSHSPSDKADLTARLRSRAIGLADRPVPPSFSSLITAFTTALQDRLHVVIGTDIEQLIPPDYAPEQASAANRS